MKARINITSSLALTLLFLCIFTLVLPCIGHAGQWRVVPARLFLDRETKSSVVTIFNESDEKLTLQMKGMEWSQDAEGKDVYRDTSDILFFPKIMFLNPKEEKIIRTGIKIPATTKEKTYRFFIEEIPQPKKEGQQDAAQVAIAVRFGVPIFVKPVKDELKGELVQFTVAKGIVTATVKNTGNTHFKIAAINVSGKNDKGEEIFSTKLDGWYLLAGTVRTYTAPMPQDKCSETRKLDISISTDKQITLSRNLNVEKAQCLP